MGGSESNTMSNAMSLLWLSSLLSCTCSAKEALPSRSVLTVGPQSWETPRSKTVLLVGTVQNTVRTRRYCGTAARKTVLRGEMAVNELNQSPDDENECYSFAVLKSLSSELLAALSMSRALMQQKQREWGLLHYRRLYTSKQQQASNNNCNRCGCHQRS